MRPITTSFQRLEGQRWLSVVIDCSEAMKDPDMPPNRLIRLLVLLPSFIHQYFDTNPLSQLQIIQTSDGLASIVSPMSGNAEGHIKALRDLVLAGRSESQKDSVGANLYQGAMSIQNSLLCALKSQRSLPKYGRREVLMILGSIASQDPSHPATCLSVATSTRTSISFVHLAAEMYICKRLANETGGSLKVPLSERDLVSTLDSYAVSGPSSSSPQPTDSSQTQGRLLVMGFPTRDTLDRSEEAALLSDDRTTETHFTCPRCLHCLPSNASLPTNCPICKLMLVKFQQLARSYAHLFQQPSLAKVENLEAPTSCFGCGSIIPPSEEVNLMFAKKSEAQNTTKTTTFEATPLNLNAATSSANNYFQDPRQEDIPAPMRAYSCEECKSMFCGVCRDGIVNHLHQCLGCLERPSN